MGIKSLFKNFKKVSGVVNTKPVSNFSDKKIGIDATGLLHRLYKESDDIQVFKNILLTFQHLKINTTFIFDNKEYKESLKDDTIKSRRHERKLKNQNIDLFEYVLSIKRLRESDFKKKLYSKIGEIREEYNDFNPGFYKNNKYNSIFTTYHMSVSDIQDVIESFQKDLKRPSDKYLKESKKMIQKMKFIVMEASKEADFTLGYLYKKKHFDFVYSDDSDLLALGVDKLLTNLNLLKLTFDVFDLTEFLKKNELNHSQFLEICILLGTDYTVPIYQIQEKPLFGFCKELILKYGSFTSIQPVMNTYLSKYPYLSEVNEKYERIHFIYTESFETDEASFVELQH